MGVSRGFSAAPPPVGLWEASQRARGVVLAVVPPWALTLSHLQGWPSTAQPFLSSPSPLSDTPSTSDRAMPPGTGHSPQNKKERNKGLRSVHELRVLGPQRREDSEQTWGHLSWFEQGHSEKMCGTMFVDCDSLDPHTYVGAISTLFFLQHRETLGQTSLTCPGHSKRKTLSGLVFEQACSLFVSSSLATMTYDQGWGSAGDVRPSVLSFPPPAS